jgi:hypothetical protein
VLRRGRNTSARPAGPHCPIGFLNPYLYVLGPTGRFFHDITVGDNAFNGVPGFS